MTKQQKKTKTPRGSARAARRAAGDYEPVAQQTHPEEQGTCHVHLTRSAGHYGIKESVQ